MITILNKGFKNDQFVNIINEFNSISQNIAHTIKKHINFSYIEKKMRSEKVGNGP